MMLRNALNSIYFYSLLPAFVAIASLCIFFNIPTFFYSGILSYSLIITFPVLGYVTFKSSQLSLTSSYLKLLCSEFHRVVIFAFCGLILLCGPLDIYFNGFKLLNPASYADIPGIGRYIRHFTVLTWLFIPVAFIYCKNIKVKVCLISYALIFPLLIIDRNRLFLSFYTLFFLLIIDKNLNLNKSINTKWFIGLIPLSIIVIFALLGEYRSGTNFLVQSSGNELMLEYYPLNNMYLSMPLFLQQVIIYLVSPIVNFSTIVASHFINPDFLLSQFSPFNRAYFELHPYVPILVPRFNVGTELYPFLLYSGLPLAFFAYLGIFVTFLFVCKLFKQYPNIFTLLIVIKITYVTLFLGFAPQFYILLNAMFFVVMISLWFSAEMLSKLSLFQRSFRWKLVG